MQTSSIPFLALLLTLADLTSCRLRQETAHLTEAGQGSPSQRALDFLAAEIKDRETLDYLRPIANSLPTEASFFAFEQYVHILKWQLPQIKRQATLANAISKMFLGINTLYQSGLAGRMFSRIRQDILVAEQLVLGFSALITSADTDSQADFIYQIFENFAYPTSEQFATFKAITLGISSKNGLALSRRALDEGETSMLADLVRSGQSLEDPATIKSYEDRLAARFDRLIPLVSLIVETPFKEAGSYRSDAERRRALSDIVDLLGQLDGSVLKALMNTGSSIYQTERGKIFAVFFKYFTVYLGARDRDTSLSIADSSKKGEPLTKWQLAALKKPRILSDASALFDSVAVEIAPELRRVDKAMSDFFSSPRLQIRPVEYQIFFLQLIRLYFPKLPEALKAHIVSEILKGKEPLSEKDQVRAIINGAGPRIQKLFQMIAREPSLDPDFAKILRGLEGSITPMPFSEVTQLLEGIQPYKTGQLHVASELPLGVGTMAEVYDGTYAEQPGAPPTRVAIRILKPGVERFLEAEWALLNEIIPEIERNPELRATTFEHFGSTAQRLDTSVRDELNVFLTTSNQKKARESFGRDLTYALEYSEGRAANLYVPKVFDDRGFGLFVTVQEFIEYESYDTFFSKHPELESSVVRDLAMYWLRESLFVSGFSHFDPHRGNLGFRMVDGKAQIILFDYGMCAQLDRSLRAKLLKLGRALSQGSSQDILDLTTTLFKSVDLARLRSLSEAAFAANQVQLDDYIQYLIAHGVDTDPKIVGFQRGLWMIKQLLSNANTGTTVTKMTEEMAERLVAIDFANHARLGPGHSELAHLTPFDVNELRELTGMSGIGGRCKLLLTSFLSAKDVIRRASVTASQEH